MRMKFAALWLIAVLCVISFAGVSFVVVIVSGAIHGEGVAQFILAMIGIVLAMCLTVWAMDEVGI